MKKKIVAILLMLLAINISNAQKFDIETIKFSGNNDKYLNIIVLGDGYTAEEQTKFIEESKKVIDYLFSQAPWSNYTNFFNVYAIKVISTQSGVNHPNTASDCGYEYNPYTNNPYFGSTFDEAGIHRLIVPKNKTLIHKVINASFSSQYAQAIIIANSSDSGGAGGEFAITTAEEKSTQIVSHEMGHSFAKLGDEYHAGDSFYFEKPNMTKTSDATLVKWKNWLGVNRIGVNKYGDTGLSASWYKPSTNCKMELISQNYCAVCTQAIIEAIHMKANPIVSYTPANTTTIVSANQHLDFNLTELIKPVPNTLNLKWKLDNAIVGDNVDFVKIDQNTLSNGLHNLVLTVTDDSSLLKVDNHPTTHLSTVTWTINKSNLGVKLNSFENKISYSMYPNPTTNSFNLEFELDKQSEVSIELNSIDGKKIRQIENKTIDSGKYSNSINIADLSAGSYLLTFKIDNSKFSKIIIKQ
jgi:hypothetical protein